MKTFDYNWKTIIMIKNENDKRKNLYINDKNLILFYLFCDECTHLCANYIRFESNIIKYKILNALNDKLLL